MMKTIERIALPPPAPGTRRELTVHRYGKPGARPRAYLQAALHADEHPGLLALNHLIRMLDQGRDPVVGEIVIVPLANPIGLSQQLHGYLLGRYDFCGGLNFNRGYPELSEPVARAVEGSLGDDTAGNIELIRTAMASALADLPRDSELKALRAALLGLSMPSDIVLDLHCDLEALVHIYASHHHRDFAVELGADLGARVVLLEKEPGGSPFDEANAGFWWKLRERLRDDRVPLACIAATVELRGQADVSDELAEMDAANLYRFLQRRGMIGGDPGHVPAPLFQATPLEATDVIAAPAAGLVVYKKELGDIVETGDIVAEIVDLAADDPCAGRTPVQSRATGLLFSRQVHKLLSPGMSVCKVAGTKILAHREAGALLEA
ncbi:MAG: succinylglutamate desuccinylase/aspartoacylase family protein [Rhodospirillales bacterium]|nr:MAG: succinylglutamate desuccinylase/aspartoacylase family protein [Rhodospirillales bacterium]